MRNCIVTCECHSQSYSFLFIDQFANSVFLISAMGYFLAPWSLLWQRKYPQIKSRKKLSEKLLCFVWIQLIQLHLYFMELFASPVFVESENWYFGSLWRLYGQRKYHQIKTRKKFSEKFCSDLWIHLRELHCSFYWVVC